MKLLLRFFVLFVSATMFVACDNDGDDTGGEATLAGDVYYVLNSGDWKSNNSSLTLYEKATGKVTQDFFLAQNGRNLGSLANDIIVYGSKMYIAVSGEMTIEVTDVNAKSVKQITCDAQPRYLASAGGKVYVTYYDGHVARIDTATLEVEAKMKVGRNPEQLAVAGNKLYVANSGGADYNTEVGYDKTVSVVDLGSFAEIGKIDVVLNPANVVSDGTGTYVASFGNYADIPSTLQYIDASGSVSVVNECPNMTEICYTADALYGFFSKYDENWNATYSFIYYNKVKGVVDSPWIKENELPIPYKISATGDFVAVTSSDYVNDGDACLYDSDGMLVAKVAAGLNPIKVVRAK